MALLAGGVAALGGRLLHTAKKPARNSSEVQQQMVRGSWLHKKDMSQEHFRGAAAHVSVCVCRQRGLQQFSHGGWQGFGLGTGIG